MAAALQFPSHDPHGAPIPTSAGEIEETDPSNLADARPGSRLRIRAVRDENPTRLRSMEAQGLRPGARIRIDGEQLEPDQVSIRLDGGHGPSRTVKRELAERVFVVAEEEE
jgi:DtxR family Mn-dependent transcriptional regulator